jgi:hypothetical protein
LIAVGATVEPLASTIFSGWAINCGRACVKGNIFLCDTEISHELSDPQIIFQRSEKGKIQSQRNAPFNLHP